VFWVLLVVVPSPIGAVGGSGGSNAGFNNGFRAKVVAASATEGLVWPRRCDCGGVEGVGGVDMMGNFGELAGGGNWDRKGLK